MPNITSERATNSKHHQIRGAAAVVAIVVLLVLVLEMTTILPTRAYSALTGAEVTTRALTHDEAELADHLFGVGFSDGVTVAAANVTSARARVRGSSTIVVPQAGYRAEDGTVEELPPGLLAHELTHVWQARTAPVRTALAAPVAIIGEQLGQLTPTRLSPYDVTEDEALREGWNGLGIEQQAEVIEAYVEDGLNAYSPYAATVQAALGIEPVDEEAVQVEVGGVPMPFEDFGLAGAEPVHIESITVLYSGIGVARTAVVTLDAGIESEDFGTSTVIYHDDDGPRMTHGLLQLDAEVAAAFSPGVVAGRTLDHLIASGDVPEMAVISLGDSK